MTKGKYIPPDRGPMNPQFRDGMHALALALELSNAALEKAHVARKTRGVLLRLRSGNLTREEGKELADLLAGQRQLDPARYEATKKIKEGKVKKKPKRVLHYDINARRQSILKLVLRWRRIGDDKAMRQLALLEDVKKIAVEEKISLQQSTLTVEEAVPLAVFIWNADPAHGDRQTRDEEVRGRLNRPLPTDPKLAETQKHRRGKHKKGKGNTP